MTSGAILAIDQGTTSTRAMIFDVETRVLGQAQEEFEQHYPRPGWVEHEPEDIWQGTLAVARRALEAAGLGAGDVAAIGITNQRETVVLWDRRSGKALHRAIVWQDRRTAELCQRLKEQGHEPTFTERTGLLLDPYFSGTKLAWLLDNVEGARAAAEAGHLAFGTIDCFLIWRLTGGRVHATDATNASRTLLYDIRRNAWDEELLGLLNIPASLLPEVRDSAADFGAAEPGLFGGPIAIGGVAGDQQAATVGQACFEPGMVKSTYGTGCFALVNTGGEPVASKHRLLTTIAYRLDGRTTYALEGSIFVAGAAVQWLRDGLGLIRQAAETGALAAAADPLQQVVLVPAFVGLGAPHWDAEARGALFGLTRNTGPKELALAALESVAFQTYDLVECMHADWHTGAAGRGRETGGDMVLRVDGGMTASDWTLQRLADILAAPVDRPTVLETTALGAAWLAGRQAGVWPDRQEFGRRWQLDRRFEPQMDEMQRRRRLALWHDAVRRTLTA
ncbi:glycerol kinase [Tistlia consotensis]|uniref:Glycerol kinase n=1 Tax=Tistlia consotensis USBA 355 TaxID=560819 RepID=A0A1Y6BMR4_9PROT|nr:glycerol kinase GlpK [Tistlia consotensis]SMF18678.1 glycerol kinase [Tistlia consotensis USBA 355]SNR39506.1 glycerol kinase [Tistlia consotensis]